MRFFLLPAFAAVASVWCAACVAPPGDSPPDAAASRRDVDWNALFPSEDLTVPRPAPRRSGCDGAGPDCQEVAFGPGVEPFADGAPDGGTHALLLDGVVVDGVGDATLPPGGTSGTIRFRWLHSVCSDWMAFRYEVSPVAVIPRGARIDGRIRLAIVEDGSAWSPWSPAGPLPLDSDDLVWRIWPANEVFTHKVFGLEAEVTLVGNDQARPVVQRLLFQSTCHLGGEELGVGLVTTPHNDSR